MSPDKPEKQKLLTDIREALALQQLEGVMETIKPIIDKFFEDHLIQAKSKIWD
jgi:hypothetical protein